MEMDNMGTVAYTENGYAFVKFSRMSACGDSCASCSKGCDAKEHLVKVDNSLGAEKGDLVEVSINVGDFLKISFLLYGLPLIILASSAIGLTNLTNNQGLAGVSSIIICLLSFFCINFFVKKRDQRGKLPVKMDKVIKSLQNIKR